MVICRLTSHDRRFSVTSHGSPFTVIQHGQLYTVSTYGHQSPIEDLQRTEKRVPSFVTVANLACESGASTLPNSGTRRKAPFDTKSAVVHIVQNTIRQAGCTALCDVLIAPRTTSRAMCKSWASFPHAHQLPTLMLRAVGIGFISSSNAFHLQRKAGGGRTHCKQTMYGRMAHRILCATTS